MAELEPVRYITMGFESVACVYYQEHILYKDHTYVFKSACFGLSRGALGSKYPPHS